MEASSTETRSSSALSLFIFVSIQEDVKIAFLHYFTQLRAALRPKAGTHPGPSNIKWSYCPVLSPVLATRCDAREATNDFCDAFRPKRR